MNDCCFEKVAENGIFLLKVPFAGIWTGVVLVQRNGFNLLIDSGADAAGVDNVIVPALKKLNMTPDKIDLLVSTHTHGDHVGGHARLLELGVQKTGIYAAGAEKLRNPLKYNIQIRSVFPEYSAPPASVLNGVEPDIVFQDGEEIAGLRLISSPGHDTDSVVYFDSATGTLLTGDSIQGNGTDTLGCALYMDLPAYGSSLKKLLQYPVKQVVTGHPFYPWIDPVIQGTKALTDSLELIDKYDDILKNQTVQSLPERTVQLIQTLNGKVPHYLFLGMYTVREHLKRTGLL